MSALWDDISVEIFGCSFPFTDVSVDADGNRDAYLYRVFILAKEPVVWQTRTLEQALRLVFSNPRCDAFGFREILLDIAHETSRRVLAVSELDLGSWRFVSGLLAVAGHGGPQVQPYCGSFTDVIAMLRSIATPWALSISDLCLSIVRDGL
jgi:hypothetical protein